MLSSSFRKPETYLRKGASEGRFQCEAGIASLVTMVCDCKAVDEVRLMHVLRLPYF